MDIGLKQCTKDKLDITAQPDSKNVEFNLSRITTMSF